MKRPGDSALSRVPTEPAAAQRPGRVAKLRGIIFQSDASSLVGALFIRPIESFDRWQAGLARGFGEEPLAMHAGLHVVLDDGREYVAEQLVGTLFEDLEDALNWTPLQRFRTREGAGWDVTVPATDFRLIDGKVVRRVIDYLNHAEGRPFVGEDCTEFIERAFGGRRLFGDSPTARNLGFGWRVGDPALPLLRPDARLNARAARLLRAKTVRAQPDPLADHDAPNAHRWLGRLIVWGVLALVLGTFARRFYRRRG